MSGRNRWVVPAAAGAAALAVVAGVVGVAVARGSAGARSAAASRPLPSGTAGALAPPDAVVHDGDRVRGQGLVVALPGRPVRLCSGATPQVVPPTRTPAYCAIGLTLVGADLGRLADRQERDGAAWGVAEVTGVYRARTVTVTAQDAPPAADPGLKPFAPGLPADCPAPAGGWPRREVQALPGIDQANQYVGAHPDVLGSLSITYPYPTRSGAIGAQVLLIGTTGDIAEATRQVRRWYAGSLCVRTVPHSRAEMLAARAVLTEALSDPARRARYGLLGGAGEWSVDGDPRTSIDALVYDEQVHRLRESAGADLVGVDHLLLRKLG
jgi:hypothetical protein